MRKQCALFLNNGQKFSQLNMTAQKDLSPK